MKVGGGVGIVPGGCTPERAAKHQARVVRRTSTLCVSPSAVEPHSFTSLRPSTSSSSRPRLPPPSAASRRAPPCGHTKGCSHRWPAWGQSLSAGGGAEGPEAGSH